MFDDFFFFFFFKQKTAYDVRISDWSSDVCSSDLGYILIYIVSMKLQLLPVQGYRSPFQGLGPFFAHIALPTLTLSVIFIALIARMTRASAIEVLQEDYVRTAYAKGQNELVILVRHVLANCAVPIVTVIGIGITLLIGGVVVTESVYNIPGLGRLVLDAVQI